MDFTIENYSIYTAYHLTIASIEKIFSPDTHFTRQLNNLTSNEARRINVVFYLSVPKSEIMKNRPDDPSYDREYILELEQKYKLPFYIYLNYRNDENRAFKKRLRVKYI